MKTDTTKPNPKPNPKRMRMLHITQDFRRGRELVTLAFHGRGSRAAGKLVMTYEEFKALPGLLRTMEVAA